MAAFRNVLVLTLVASVLVSQVTSISVEKLAKKKKTTTPAPDDNRCMNGGVPPYCCANGSTSPYCCANNSPSPYCCANKSMSRYCCENGSEYSDCRPTSKKPRH